MFPILSVWANGLSFGSFLYWKKIGKSYIFGLGVKNRFIFSYLHAAFYLWWFCNTSREANY